MRVTVSQCFTPKKLSQLVKKRKTRIYFRSQSRVSKEAMEEARRTATFRVENENGKGGKTSTKILRTKRCMQYAVQIKNLSQA